VDKQYMVFAVPLALLLFPRPIPWKEVGAVAWKAALLGLALSAPLALWNLPAFLHDVVALQFRQPMRVEALSFVAWLKEQGITLNTAAIGFVAGAVVVALAIRRLERSVTAFALALAVTFFAFFAFNRQAFANYYYLVLGALAWAIALDGDGHPEPEQTPETPPG